MRRGIYRCIAIESVPFHVEQLFASQPAMYPTAEGMNVPYITRDIFGLHPDSIYCRVVSFANISGMLNDERIYAYPSKRWYSLRITACRYQDCEACKLILRVGLYAEYCDTARLFTPSANTDRERGSKLFTVPV
jgi:hypothetical protein